MNKTLTKYFSKISLQKLWDASLDDFENIPETQRLMLLAICENRPANLEEIYHFLDQPDALFNDIYQEREVRDSVLFYTYPFIHGAAIPDDIEEVVAPIGTQTSKYHHENLRDHVALVAANLVDAGLSGTLAVQLAVLHDVGKKYTAATNKVGDICYYNHEAVSALIAKYWLRGTASQSTIKQIVTVIYAHLLPLTTWNRTVHWKTGLPCNFRQDFEHELESFYDGNQVDVKRTMELIDTLTKCDEGILEMTPEYAQKIARGRELIHEFRHGT